MAGEIWVDRLRADVWTLNTNDEDLVQDTNKRLSWSWTEGREGSEVVWSRLSSIVNLRVNSRIQPVCKVSAAYYTLVLQEIDKEQDAKPKEAIPYDGPRAPSRRSYGDIG